jgi:isocitrate dehydrogenase kinase/phosphatase
MALEGASKSSMEDMNRPILRDVLPFTSLQSVFQQVLVDLHACNVDYRNVNALLNLVVSLVFREFRETYLADRKLAFGDFVLKRFLVDFSAKKIAIQPEQAIDAIC